MGQVAKISSVQRSGGNITLIDFLCMESFTKAMKVSVCLCARRQSRKKPRASVAEKTPKRARGPCSPQSNPIFSPWKKLLGLCAPGYVHQGVRAMSAVGGLT